MCLRHLLRASLVVQSHLAHTDSDACGQSILVSFSFPHSTGDSKPIARPFQNGFLQVAVSKTLRPPAFPAPESFICRSVSDTALGLDGTRPTRCSGTSRIARGWSAIRGVWLANYIFGRAARSDSRIPVAGYCSRRVGFSSYGRSSLMIALRRCRIGADNEKDSIGSAHVYRCAGTRKQVGVSTPDRIH